MHLLSERRSCHVCIQLRRRQTYTARREGVSFRVADASIWLVQFIKAMRNQEGDLVRNAHLRGFFSRICKCGMVPQAVWGLFDCSAVHGCVYIYVHDAARLRLQLATALKTPVHMHHVVIARLCCRLLFHRVRPVFVFDGGTPAEKLLLAQLKWVLYQGSFGSESNFLKAPEMRVAVVK
jgi:XPG N-terminal domain